MPAKTRILFVDDEPMVLQGLRRMLHSARDQWEIAFASGGQEALDLLAERPFDVIVTDIRMPGMTGADLLEAVRSRYPHMIRMVLSGQASRETVLQSVGPTHQYLPKPCDAESLKAALGRIGMVRQLLSAERLRGVVSALESLPSLPSLYRDLARELASPQPSAAVAARIIGSDLAMSGKIVQLMSSGFFGTARRVASPAEAAVALGLDILRPLALTRRIFVQFEEDRSGGLALEALQNHSLTVAAVARRIAQVEWAARDVVEYAFMAGLLHDVGKVVLSHQLPDDYAAALALVRDEGQTPLQAEQAAFGATHAEVGAYLLGIWGLHDPVVDVLAHHHCPQRSRRAEGFTPLTAVHAANAIVHEEMQDPPASPVDVAYLDGLGLTGRLAAWREAARECCAKEAAHA